LRMQKYCISANLPKKMLFFLILITLFLFLFS